ncbi:hypothetical protein IJG21_02555 [Candidatus Saccharibacteria bacterium]|nr:hypothetical protein [Candidatus Saccharibacteria bacterium]
MVEKSKKAIKGMIVVLGIILVFSLIVGVRGFLERTRVFREEAEVVETEEASEELKYITARLRAKLVLEFLFREETAKESLGEISEIRAGLKEVDEGKLRELYREDRKELEKELSELEGILRREGLEEGDRQLKFIEKVAEYTARERIGFFTSRVAFNKDEGELERFGVFLLNGAEILTQETEEKINVFLGGEAGVGMTTEDLEKVREKAGEVFAVEKGTGKKIKVGEGLEGLMKEGKLRAVKVGFSMGEIKTTEITLRRKATWDLEGELEARGITGLVGEAYVENNLPETLKDSLKRLGGE